MLLWAPERRGCWRVCPQEAEIAQGQVSRAVNLYPVLIVAGRLYYDARSVPLGWVVALLVLKEHPLTNGYGAWRLEWALRDSVVRAMHVRMASSLAAQAWRQRRRTWGLENLSSLFKNVRPSQSGRSKMICAGERLQSGSGVLRSCNIARKNRS